MHYNTTLDADVQITAEERIAALLQERGESLLADDGIDEEVCAQLGRDILRQVLEQFRPDLFEEERETGWDQKIGFDTIYDEIPTGLRITAERAGEGDYYHELAVDAHDAEGNFLANVLIGTCADGDLRVLLTTGDQGAEDHTVAVYPQRPRAKAVDTRFN